MVKEGDRFEAINGNPPELDLECHFQRWVPSKIAGYFSERPKKYRISCRITIGSHVSTTAIDCDTEKCPIYSIYTQTRKGEKN